MKRTIFCLLLGFQILQAQELIPLPIPTLEIFNPHFYSRGGRQGEIFYGDYIYPPTLNITILDKTDSQPLVFVQIKFIDLKTKQEQFLFTDEYGRICLGQMPEGKYSIELFPDIGRGEKRFRYKKYIDYCTFPDSNNRYTFKL